MTDIFLPKSPPSSSSFRLLLLLDQQKEGKKEKKMHEVPTAQRLAGTALDLFRELPVWLSEDG